MATRSSKRGSQKRTSDVDDQLAGSPPKPKRCKAKTAKGTRCTYNAMPGSERCARHLRPVGRPTKLTKEVTAKIVTILALGGYAETAAIAAGVSKKTFYEWLKRGDPDSTKPVDAPYRDFREQIDKARAEGEQANVAFVTAAATRDWKAAAWLLERQAPDRWAGPRGRRVDSSIHPDDFAAGETSSQQEVIDDQVGPDGRPL